MKKIYIEFALLFSAILWVLTGCSMSRDYSEQGIYFDTIITLNIYGTKDKAVMQDCLILCEDFEKKFSKTVEDSDVWKLNHAQGAWVEVSEETIDILKEAIKYSELTEGAFDVSVAPLTELWQVNNSTLPTEEERKIAMSHVNYQFIEIDGNKVRLTDKKAQIDLGGIAKGYIADKLAELMKERGVTSAMINLGGNIKVVGGKKNGGGWKIAIQKPFANSDEVIGSINIEDKTVVTSGIYQRYFEYDGKIYHHIIDKTTGAPSESDLASVTVIGESSTAADALSTACILLGSEKGMALIEDIEDVEAVFVTRDGTIAVSSGALQMYWSKEQK